MRLPDFLDHLRTAPDIAPCIERWHREAPREAVTADFPDWTPDAVRKAYARAGVTELWSHQREAAEHAYAGRHVAVVTPTASGKTLCYNLPVLTALLGARAGNGGVPGAADAAAARGVGLGSDVEPAGRALYLFPTKALSRDQLHSFAQLSGDLPRPVNAGVFDGDTSPSKRRALRGGGDVVVTNPYMLHSGILPHHLRWGSLFRDLRYVVVDEMHTLTGVFGSNVANVLRRLRRVCRHHGSNPTFLLCSATLRNPGELARSLVGEEVQVVSRCGAPAAERHLVLFNPPVIDEATGQRASALEEARRIATEAVKHGLQTLVFARSRQSVEVLTKYMKDAGAELGLPPDAIRGYRGGYLPELRREVERGLRDGSVRIVVATNALELGIDIGGLDVVVLTGYPGRVSSARQQAGRSGRRQFPGTAVLVARSDPLDQYVLQHPEMLTQGHSERALIDPDNRLIFTSHVRCAGFELPFREGEEFGESGLTRPVLQELAAPGGPLHLSGGRYHWADTSFPADGVSLNGFDIDDVAIYDLDRRVVLAEVDRASAAFFVHQHAIYGHQGDTYYVERFDYDGRRAYVRKVDCDYYTEAEAEVEVRTLAEDHVAEFESFRASRGSVLVTTQVPLFKKIRFYTGENVGAGAITLPAEQLGTSAVWIDVGPELASEMRILEGGRSQALRGVASLLRAVAPVFLRCDRSDLRVHAEARAASTELPRIVAFDRVPNGVGLAEGVFSTLRGIIHAMREIVETCRCKAGCPGCVGPTGNVGPYGKEVARQLLRGLTAALDAHPDVGPQDLAPPIEDVPAAGESMATASLAESDSAAAAVAHVMALAEDRSRTRGDASPPTP